MPTDLPPSLQHAARVPRNFYPRGPEEVGYTNLSRSDRDLWFAYVGAVWQADAGHRKVAAENALLIAERLDGRSPILAACWRIAAAHWSR